MTFTPGTMDACNNTTRHNKTKWFKQAMEQLCTLSKLSTQFLGLLVGDKIQHKTILQQLEGHLPLVVSHHTDSFVCEQFSVKFLNIDA